MYFAGLLLVNLSPRLFAELVFYKLTLYVIENCFLVKQANKLPESVLLKLMLLLNHFV